MLSSIILGIRTATTVASLLPRLLSITSAAAKEVHTRNRVAKKSGDLGVTLSSLVDLNDAISNMINPPKRKTSPRKVTTPRRKE